MASLRNGVPDSESRRAAWPKATRMLSPQALSWPAWWISSRMTKPSADRPAQLCRGVPGGDLLVGGHEPVHVAGQAVAGAPVGVELEAESVRRQRPLHLEVAGRGDDDEDARFVGEAGASTGQRKRRLSGARRGDGEEVGLGAGPELLVGGALPGAQGHGRHRPPESGAETPDPQPPPKFSSACALQRALTGEIRGLVGVGRRYGGGR